MFMKKRLEAFLEAIENRLSVALNDPTIVLVAVLWLELWLL